MQTLEEPISPELALVDPELRRRALACLPDPPWMAFALPAATKRDAVPAPAPQPKPRRRAGRLAIAAILIAVVVAALLAVELTRPAPAVEEVPAGEAAADAPVRSAAASRGSHLLRHVAGHGPLREFAWAPVRGAAAYRFALARGTAEILSARTPEARIAIPHSWRYDGRAYRLTPGTYRWVVRPAFRSHGGIRYGSPVVSSRLTVNG
jgi:hypothetical protein